eukprot:6969462-Prymnesium_polylepis.1
MGICTAIAALLMRIASAGGHCGLWPMAYGAPCGGSGRYAVRGLWPMVAYGLWCAVRRCLALRAPCGASSTR